MAIFQKFCIFALKRKIIDEDEIEVFNKINFFKLYDRKIYDGIL